MSPKMLHNTQCTPDKSLSKFQSLFRTQRSFDSFCEKKKLNLRCVNVVSCYDDELHHQSWLLDVADSNGHYLTLKDARLKYLLRCLNGRVHIVCKEFIRFGVVCRRYT